MPEHNRKTGLIIFADGNVFYGTGFGAQTSRQGEVCFNTSMTGYQEVLTDPSYAGQIITFTFPHIGNVGTNKEDYEAAAPHACGLITREIPTAASNWRSSINLDEWLQELGLPGVAHIDTRALTRHIRENGAPNAIIAHDAQGRFDLPDLKARAASLAGLEGIDMSGEVTCPGNYRWENGLWSWGTPHAAVADASSAYLASQRPKSEHQESPGQDKKISSGASGAPEDPRRYKVVAIDYGAKHNILRHLRQRSCDVFIVPAGSPASAILDMEPDGIFLSNGPGDPAATARHAVPTIQTLLKRGTPLFGICLGHQLLALALGGRTEKMHLGHRGANHPVQDLTTGKVEITSQNHGFVVIPDSLPENVETTHVSLFDGSNEGLRLKNRPVFSVQYHPEASPGPADSGYLFDRFVAEMKKYKAASSPGARAKPGCTGLIEETKAG